MRTIPVRTFGRVIFAAALVPCLVLTLAASASAAGYPRRIAIAPFSVLTKEDIGATVSVLPRLLSSRLMALAGADVLVIPQGKPPVEAAKEAKYPLLLQGTVSKLGKGYSIDTVVTDLSGGGSAGAFFAVAATEDEIIAQLGALSGEIAEKLFGVQGAVRAVSPPAPAPLAVPVPSPAASAAVSALPPTSSPPAAAVSAPAVPAVPEGKWTPSSIKRISRSDKIPDEVHGVVAGDADPEGNGEVIAFGRKTVYVYRVKGKDLLPYIRITKGLPGRILNVETIDLDGDGKKEILVSGLEGEYLGSVVLKRKGDVYEPVASRIPWFLVVLPDWQGKPVTVGQRLGSDAPFEGKMYTMSWTGKTLAEGAPLPADTRGAPLSSGVQGLSSARLGQEWRLIYTDQDCYLRILDASGKTEYRSGGSYGASTDDFEYGMYIPKTGKNKKSMKKAARVTAGAEGSPLFVIPKIRKGLLTVSALQESKSISILQWSDGEFAERADTGEGDYTYSGADFLPPSPLRKGGRVIASAIEKTGFAAGVASRLLLYSVE